MGPKARTNGTSPDARTSRMPEGPRAAGRHPRLEFVR
jgi:hypothetical protein